MIDKCLVFLKDCLNNHLNSGSTSNLEDKVVFLEGQNMEPLIFKMGAVSILLINIEEEKILRAPDQYNQLSAKNGNYQKGYPNIRLNLYVLFVAHFRQYEEALRYLSLIIWYFQSNRVFDHHNAPDLNKNIEKLIMELITQPFSEQNEVWNALRVTYHPSVLYRVKMLVFQDQDVLDIPEIKETEVDTRNMS